MKEEGEAEGAAREEGGPGEGSEPPPTTQGKERRQGSPREGGGAGAPRARRGPKSRGPGNPPAGRLATGGFRQPLAGIRVDPVARGFPFDPFSDGFE